MADQRDLYHAHVKGWRDGAGARERATFDGRADEKLRTAYEVGYEAGMAARANAQRAASAAYGYRPNPLRDAVMDLAAPAVQIGPMACEFEPGGPDGVCRACGLEPGDPLHSEERRRQVEALHRHTAPDGSWVLPPGSLPAVFLERGEANLRAAAEEAAADARPATPCPTSSSLTGQPCLLEEGHPPFGPTRFHRYGDGGRPAGAVVRVEVDPTMPEGTAKLGPVTITGIGGDDGPSAGEELTADLARRHGL